MCSGGVEADNDKRLHNPVKHCGLSSRRSRVQIPAGAIVIIISFIRLVLNKYHILNISVIL